MPTSPAAAPSIRRGTPTLTLPPALHALGGPTRVSSRRVRAPLAQRERDAGAGEPFRIGLCTPMRGAAGIWGPSCVASAQLGLDELNRGAGIAHRPCELQFIDASAESPDIERSLIDLVDSGEIDAIVGMCLSSVRKRIVSAVGGRIPFVYTCLYEGGESTPRLYAIGETAAQQLEPSIAWLSASAVVKRWMLVGHDYIWPRVSHVIARRCIADSGGEVVAEAVVPFGTDDYSAVFERLRKTRADACLMSMVGQEAVDFNRAFAREGLARSVMRLSCAIEENQLLAIGAENTENLHVALGYFGALQTDANLAFKERYHTRFSRRAPMLNSLGQSLYEGVHFLANLMNEQHTTGRGSHRTGTPVAYPSARSAVYAEGGAVHAPMYLARAEGHAFRVLTQF